MHFLSAKANGRRLINLVGRKMERTLLWAAAIKTAFAEEPAL